MVSSNCDEIWGNNSSIMQQAADYSRGVLYEGGGVWAPSTIQGQTADAAKCPDFWSIRILLSRHFNTTGQCMWSRVKWLSVCYSLCLTTGGGNPAKRQRNECFIARTGEDYLWGWGIKQQSTIRDFRITTDEDVDLGLCLIDWHCVMLVRDRKRNYSLLLLFISLN